MQKSVLVAVSRWKFFHKYKLRRRWTKKYMVRAPAVALMQSSCAACCKQPFTALQQWVKPGDLNRPNMLRCAGT